MSPQQFREIAWNGLWKQNTGLAQLLGLCPILAVSTSMVNAVSLGLATILVMALSNLAVSALRNFIPYEIRIPVFILIIAALVTVVDLSFNAFVHDLYLVLGIFIPLIVTNCIVLARVEAFAAKNEPGGSTVDGIAMGIGYGVTEDFPYKDGVPQVKLAQLGIIKANQMPTIKSVFVDRHVEERSYGAKGVGEITCCLAAPARNASCASARASMSASPVMSAARTRLYAIMEFPLGMAPS